MQNKTNQGQKVVPPILNREQGRGFKVFAAQLYADFLWVPPPRPLWSSPKKMKGSECGLIFPNGDWNETPRFFSSFDKEQ